MGATGLQVVRWRGERARVGPWRGGRGVARVTPVGDGSLPSSDLILRCLDRLRADGYQRVVSGALHPGEVAPFLTAGFAVDDRLHVLAHDLRTMPPLRPSPLRLRRARRRDRRAALAVDRAAFAPTWHLESAGLAEALSATPRTRFRVALDERGRVAAYAVTGRSGRRGYVQRVAVAPDAQRMAAGWNLVADALRWLRRWRVRHVVVNTQVTNDAALALYEALGFRRQASGLVVLARDLDE